MGNEGNVQDGQIEVTDPVTKMAHALWNGVWDLAAVNEQHKEAAHGAGPTYMVRVRQYAAKYGEFDVRRERGINALRAFYAEFFGETGQAAVDEWFDAQQGVMFSTRQEARDRLNRANQTLADLHDGIDVIHHTMVRYEPPVLTS